MRILLLEPPFFRLLGEKRIYVPVGLLYLAKKLEDGGHDTIVFNSDSDYSTPNETVLSYREKYFESNKIIHNSSIKNEIFNDIFSLIDDFMPNIIGISVKSESVPVVVELLDLIKKLNINIKTILGGPHFNVDPVSIYFKKVDYIMIGEAENNICEVVDAVFNKKDPVFNKNIVNLEELPLLTLKYLPKFQKKNIQNQKKQLISTARGCPFKCSFCYKSISVQTGRFLSGENIYLNIEKFYTEYKIDKFFIVDDTFGVDSSQLSTFVDLIVRTGLPVSWSCMSHASILTENKIAIMHQGGCKSIHLGVESGSDNILRLLNKKTSTKQIDTVSKLMHKYNIKLHAFMMVGLPGETKEDIELSVELVNKIKPSEIAAQVYQPYPNTLLFKKLLEQNHNIEIDWPSFTRLSLHDHHFRGSDAIEVNERINSFLNFADNWNSTH